MIYKFTIATVFFGLLIPSAGIRAEQPETQINTYPEGFFYSQGRSYLGVEVKDITADRVSALKLKEERGVEITMVDQDAPASKAGIKEHDVVLEYNGTRVESEEQFRRMIRETPPGRNVTLGISRDGNPMTLTMQIGDRGKLTSKIWRGPIGAPPEPPEPPDFNIPFDVQALTYTPALGIQVENLTQQLGEFFGVKNGGGLLIKSVEKSGAAAKAGLKAGDVITRVNNEKVADRADLRRILHSHRDGGKVTVGVMRDKHEQNFEIELPARKSGDSSSIEILAPDVESFEDLDSSVREQVNKAHTDYLAAQTALMRVKPEIQKSMNQLQLNMQGWQDQLEKSDSWRIEFHDFI